jgi:hypothetical protein
MMKRFVRPTARACLVMAMATTCWPTTTHGQCTFDVSAKILASDGAAYDRLGMSVAICGEVAVVGVPYSGDQDDGAAYVYEAEQQGDDWVWTQTQKLTASDAAAIAQFGYSVAIDGNVMLIGAPLHDNEQHEHPGAAYVFRYIGSSWVETRIMDLPRRIRSAIRNEKPRLWAAVGVAGACRACANQADSLAFLWGSSASEALFLTASASMM